MAKSQRSPKATKVKSQPNPQSLILMASDNRIVTRWERHDLEDVLRFFIDGRCIPPGCSRIHSAQWFLDPSKEVVILELTCEASPPGPNPLDQLNEMSSEQKT